MAENLTIYNAVRAVPDEAKKPIKAGRLTGKTDINPMWRIKMLTEQFGPCGIGWRPTDIKFWLEQATNGEVAAFCRLLLLVKYNGAWSEGIEGIGGSMFVANETKGPYVSDECYKMAYTDALSVACKMLGMGADVYWERDDSKYNKEPLPATPRVTPQAPPPITPPKAPPSGNAPSIKQPAEPIF